jgi:hypothetical protein
METKELQTIDAEYIRELKREGKGRLANDLIKLHQKTLKKNRENDRYEFGLIEKRKLRFLYKQNGLCIVCGKVPPRKNRSKCSHCFELAYYSQRKKRELLKEQGLCMYCGQIPARPDSVSCQNCASKRQRCYNDK